MQKAGPFLQEPACSLGQTIISAQVLAGKAASRCPPVARRGGAAREAEKQGNRGGELHFARGGGPLEEGGRNYSSSPPPPPTLPFVVQVDLGNHGNRE